MLLCLILQAKGQAVYKDSTDSVGFGVGMHSKIPEKVKGDTLWNKSYTGYFTPLPECNYMNIDGVMWVREEYINDWWEETCNKNRLQLFEIIKNTCISDEVLKQEIVSLKGIIKSQKGIIKQLKNATGKKN